MLKRKGKVKYDGVIDHSVKKISAGGGNTLRVSLDHLVNPPAIGLKVTTQQFSIISVEV